jgi:hypothetical protein
MSADSVLRALRDVFIQMPTEPGMQTVTASWESNEITVSISIYAPYVDGKP